MGLLESAMAFAVVMMILSTLVTGIVETIFTFLGTREKTLQQAIQALFQQVIWPRLGNTLAGMGVEPAEPNAGPTPQEHHRDKFVSEMTDNLVFAEDGRGAVVGRLSNLNKTKIDTLTVLSFAERLGKSHVGKAVVAEGEAEIALLVQDFARTYERFCRAASEVFRKKAHSTAVFVSLVLAFTANIDASRVLKQLVENPDVRLSFIEQADEARTNNEAAVAHLAGIEKSLAEATGNPQRDPAAATKELADLQAQVRETTDQVRATVGTLEEEGLAVGWKYFPYCQGNAVVDPDCSDGGGLGFASWLFMTALAGVLIGLGGPFWFKVFTGLSQVFQMLRDLGIRKPDEKKEEGPQKTAAEDSAKPKDVLDAFKVAVAVNLGSTVGALRGRVLLGPNGQPLN
jgi:hypothetical protein